MARIEHLPDGSRRVTLWKRDGVDMDRYPSADTRADSHSHTNPDGRNTMSAVVDLEKKAARHEARFGPLGKSTPPSVSGLPQALTKAEELQKADSNLSSAEAFRRTMKDPAIAAQYERERGGAQGAAPSAVGLAKAERVAEELQKSDPAMSSAEAFRQAMRTPAIRDAYDRETGFSERVRTIAKTEKVKALDEASVERRAEQLEGEGLPWRVAWSQAITESGHGGGARAAA